MDDLEQLLIKADVAAPSIRPHLAQAVRQAVRRRRRERRVVAATLAAVSIGAVSLRFLPKQPTPERNAPLAIDLGSYRKDLAALDAEATFHAQTAAKIAQAIERQKRLQTSEDVLSRSEISNVFDDDRRETAARLMLAHARQLDLDPLQREAAKESYRKVLAMFPNTVAGGEASDRLRAGL